MTIRSSLSRVASDLLAIVHTRFELLSLELAEQRGRLFCLLALFGASLLFALLSVVMFSFFLIAFFWDTNYRYWALGGLSVVYASLALGLCWRLVYRLKNDSLPFEASIQALKEDVNMLSLRTENMNVSRESEQSLRNQHER